MKKAFELEQYVEKMYNDTYFSELVADYDKNKTKDGFIDICKVLSYRTVYLGLAFEVLNKKLLKKLKKENQIPFECMNDSSLIDKDVLKITNPFEDDTYLLCVFTDPSKIDFNSMPINGMQVNDLNYLWENYISKEEYEGIIINPGNEGIVIDKVFIEGIINDDYSNIEMVMSILHRLNNMSEGEDIQSILNEYLGPIEEKNL